MASSGKKATTMAKLNRENRLRERRLEKQAKKDAKKRHSADRPATPATTQTDDAAVTQAGDATATRRS